MVTVLGQLLLAQGLLDVKKRSVQLSFASFFSAFDASDANCTDGEKWRPQNLHRQLSRPVIPVNGIATCCANGHVNPSRRTRWGHFK